MAKRTLDTFFKPTETTTKKSRIDDHKQSEDELSRPENERVSTSSHPSYPAPIAGIPLHIAMALEHGTPAASPKTINDKAHLDLLYFQPFIVSQTARELFQFLRRELPFYRVKYSVRRGTVETQINTPRFTTVFGVDETSRFVSPAANSGQKGDPSQGVPGEPDGRNAMVLVDSKTKQPVKPDKYKYMPRPIPACLDMLRQRVQAAIDDGSTYNFCLVNYYASGDDSISYHSDDERFLGPNPSIASLSLGAQRDFLLKPKWEAHPAASTGQVSRSRPSLKPLKYPLASGDMVVMRGGTQSNWLHSIPKRKGGEADKGRINITFRKALVPGGTNNYYTYNVGQGTVYRWDETKRQMVATE